jgi:hypothetical protein
MQMTTSSFQQRFSIICVALLAFAALTGCGGGGSGGSGLGATPGFAYQELLNASNDKIGGFSSAYTLSDPPGNVLTSTAAAAGGTVSASRNGPEFTFIVTGLQIGAGLTEPQFQFTVNFVTPAGAFGTLHPLAGQPCVGSCFRTGTADGVSFTYLDLAAAGMTYSTLGLWSKPSTVVANTEVGGAFAFGVLTRGVDIPTSALANATYTGPFVGRYADGTDVYTVGATATAAADFSSRTVTFNTTNSRRSGTLDLGLNLTGALTYLPGTNSLEGTVATVPLGHGMSGIAKGAFFGPGGSTVATSAPAELGGVVAVSNSPTTPDKSMVGSFALKK